MTDGYVETQNYISAEEKLAHESGLSLDFTRILFSRGIDTPEKIAKFLKPEISEMSCPFDILNITEAVNRIKTAVERREKILIFGDYDCDGISATSIFMLYFRSQNLKASYFIPNRNSDGYGMSLDTLKPIVENARPDLLITVDCGVTAVAEVEYLKSNGIDVIVTDHHEPQEKLPDCIVVDPKIERKGFFEFCGAGVALKVVEGLTSREEILNYIDIAAIATIADIVPLTGENRIIAYHGIKILNKKMRKGVELLMGSKSCNSYEIMYKLAPRINAAGRMDTAMKAVDIFLSDDYFVLEGLAAELNSDNILRQEYCERVVATAKEKLKGTDFSQCRFIALYDESWEAGVLGIAAARLVEEFNRPAVLFSAKEGILKGSARSVKEVNIFAILTEYSDLFVSFGGHSQAAGVTMKVENFELFKNSANAYLKKNFADSVFKKSVSGDFRLSLDRDLIPFAKELEMLEPTGYGNPKPLFTFSGSNLRFEQIGISNHIKCACKNVEIIGFTKIEYMLSAECQTEFEAVLSRNVYQNNEYAQLILRGIYVDEISDLKSENLMIKCLHQLSEVTAENFDGFETVTQDTARKYLEQSFGTLFVCFTQEGYNNVKKLTTERLPVSVGLPPNENPVNQIVLCPSKSFDFRFFNRVIFAEVPTADGYNARVSKDCYTYALDGAEEFRFKSVNPETLRTVFLELRAYAEKRKRITNLDTLYKTLKHKNAFSKYELAVALQIFSELRLISVNEKAMIEISDGKKNLENSATYRNLLKYN